MRSNEIETVKSAQFDPRREGGVFRVSQPSYCNPQEGARLSKGKEEDEDSRRDHEDHNHHENHGHEDHRRESLKKKLESCIKVSLRKPIAGISF